jgi:DNA-binding CsgD family transcriptional regulator/tetratricopeptide (TPR) repeat protein
VHGWDARKPPAAPSGSPALDGRPPAGREREHEVLRDLAGRLARGDPAHLVVRGPAGIGKSTLWQIAGDLARGAGVQVLEVRPVETELELPFVGLMDLVRATEPNLERLPERSRAVIEAAVSGQATGQAADRFELCVAVHALLTTTARAAPVLLAVDDAQWLDDASRHVLRFALRRLLGAPLGVLDVARPDADPLLPGDPPGALPPLWVGPLAPRALGAMIETRLDRRLSEPVLDRLADRVDGNPLHALELVRALPPDARLAPGEAHEVPETVGVLLAPRIASLTPPARELVLALALAVLPTVRLAERLGGDGLAELVRGGIVVVRGGRVRFSHPLLVEAAADQASPARRREVHRLLATLADDRAARALHRALAAEEPDEAVAAALEGAGGEAHAHGAPEMAAELLEHAARLTPARRAAVRRARLRRAAHHHADAGEGPRARTLLEGVLASTPAGAQRAEVLCELAAIAERTTEAAELAEAAVAEARDDATACAVAHQVAGAAAGIALDLDRWEAHIEAAAELSASAGGPAAASALAELGVIRCIRGQDVQRALWERALQHLGEPSGPERLANPLLRPELNFALQLTWAGAYDEARGVIGSRLVQLHPAAGVATSAAERSWALVLLAELEIRAGRWQEADRLADEALAVAEAARTHNLLGGALHVRALVDAHLGRARSARALAERGLEETAAGGESTLAVQLRAVLGFLALSEEDFAQADEHLAAAGEALHRHGWAEPWLVPAVHDRGEALVGLGRADEAQALAERLLAVAERLSRSAAVACAHRTVALAAAARNASGAALQACDAALAAAGADPFGIARTQLVRGAVLRRAGHRAEAREALDAAERGFRGLGATLWAARARAEAGRFGGRRPAAPGELTASEERIAGLAAQGLTNREIAARLYVTVKTVEAALSSVYRKLGIRSRTELALRRTSPS